MNELILLTDGSVNTRTHVGYGAYLVVSEPGSAPDESKARVKVKRFEDTSATKLELQTLLWALGEIQGGGGKLVIYTDSQNLVGLVGRRKRLGENEYCSKKNRRLTNHELYREFYRVIDQLDCELIKVRGHQVSQQKDDIDRLFTLVDRAARRALRGEARLQQAGVK